jgi:hypothetical protein
MLVGELHERADAWARRHVGALVAGEATDGRVVRSEEPLDHESLHVGHRSQPMEFRSMEGLGVIALS